MHALALSVVASLFLAAPPTPNNSDPPVAADAAADRSEIAQQLVRHLAEDKFDQAVKPFDETMARVLPAEKLEQAWQMATAPLGKWLRVERTRTEQADAYHIVLVTGAFQHGTLDIRVVFDGENRVAGLFFVPTESYRAPPYVDSKKFRDHDITVGEKAWPLPGSLSLPTGDGPFAAVVLVHGSGPGDRDETVGAVKPFRDLAHGLASRGIAVLRYEKRTRQHGLRMALFGGNFTVHEETVADAVAAVQTLSAHEKINRERIYVLGHSWGGYLVPRIAQASHQAAGFVSLAGSARPIEDLIVEQTQYLLGLKNEISDDDRKQLEVIQRQAAQVKSPEALRDEPQPLLGAPDSYWLDLHGYDPAREAKPIKRPLLFLQGERDYQVTLTDLERWRQALADRPNVKFIAYPKLNHLFVAGEGKSTPAEYSVPGNVAAGVIQDIAAWIEQSPATAPPKKHHPPGP